MNVLARSPIHMLCQRRGPVLLPIIPAVGWMRVNQQTNISTTIIVIGASGTLLSCWLSRTPFANRQRGVGDGLHLTLYDVASFISRCGSHFTWLRGASDGCTDGLIRNRVHSHLLILRSSVECRIKVIAVRAIGTRVHVTCDALDGLSAYFSLWCVVVSTIV